MFSVESTFNCFQLLLAQLQKQQRDKNENTSVTSRYRLLLPACRGKCNGFCVGPGSGITSSTGNKVNSMYRGRAVVVATVPTSSWKKVTISPCTELDSLCRSFSLLGVVVGLIVVLKTCYKQYI